MHLLDARFSGFPEGLEIRRVQSHGFKRGQTRSRDDFRELGADSVGAAEAVVARARRSAEACLHDNILTVMRRLRLKDLIESKAVTVEFAVSYTSRGTFRFRQIID